MRDIVIFGCGGHGREVLQIVLDQNVEVTRWRMLGFLVSKGIDAPPTVKGYPVFHDVEALGDPARLNLAIAIGNGQARKDVMNDLVRSGLTSFPSLVHPTAWIGRDVELGQGVIVCAGALLTTDIALGDHTHVNIGATISHDCRIGAFSTLSPGVNLAGRVTLGEGVEVGTAASIIPGIKVGSWSVIGASAAVVQDIPEGCTAVGVPAKVIKHPLD